jgi:hypothetical protein
MKRQEKHVKLPILYYEEAKPGEPVNPIPYIEIGLTEEMPRVLFIQEYKETEEKEVDTINGGTNTVVDMIMHQFVDVYYLQKALTPSQYDKVRVALGMLPLKEAKKRGKSILSNVFNNASQHREELINNQEKRSERAFSLGENLRVKSENFLKQNNTPQTSEETH